MDRAGPLWGAVRGTLHGQGYGGRGLLRVLLCAALCACYPATAESACEQVQEATLAAYQAKADGQSLDAATSQLRQRFPSLSTRISLIAIQAFATSSADPNSTSFLTFLTCGTSVPLEEPPHEIEDHQRWDFPRYEDRRFRYWRRGGGHYLNPMGDYRWRLVERQSYVLPYPMRSSGRSDR